MEVIQMTGLRSNKFFTKRALLTLSLIMFILPIGAVFADDGWEDSVFSLQQAFRDVSAEVLPVVVEINVVDVVEQQYNGSNPFGFFFGWPFQEEGDSQDSEPQTREFRQEGLGSGVIVDKRGDTVYVLTNNHVAGEADEISITLYDKRTFEGTLVGKDPLRDLALVSFETDEFVPVAKLGDSDSLEVGDWVLAIGNPYGFESTVTSGIVSAKGRRQSPDGQSITDYIQTDAAINQGNSGGALVNLHGEVIGINSWIASQSGGSIGLGFAIPVNNATPAIADFIDKGSVEYGWLGVYMGDLSANLKEEMGFDVDKGVFVYNVYDKSPAMDGDLQPGDLIVSINGMELESSNDLQHAIANREPGEKISMQIIRENRNYDLNITLGLRNMDEDSPADNLWPGFTVAPLTRELQERLNLPRNSGNIIIGSVAEESKAGALGLQNGDVIKSINDKNVKSISDFYNKIRNQERLELTIIRRGYELEYRLSL